jgi:hypothetical protein
MCTCCTPLGLDWGTVSPDDDPTLDFNVRYGRGPEAITIPVPEQAIDYRVGVHHSFDNGYGPSAAVVNIYCYGSLEQSFGPVTLQGSNLDDTLNDFWKVADMSFGPSSCTVTELEDVLGGPLIVTGAEAALAR